MSHPIHEESVMNVNGQNRTDHFHDVMAKAATREHSPNKSKPPRNSTKIANRAPSVGIPSFANLIIVPKKPKPPNQPAPFVRHEQRNQAQDDAELKLESIRL
jgi:hypothetical protein